MWEEASPYQRNSGSIHTHTRFSGTRFSPRQTADFARRHGLKILIFTDYSDRKWRYRWGMRMERPSILSKGINNYLSMIREVGEQFQEMIVLGGVEVSPFYYWEGNPLQLSCREYNRHILVYGLETAGDYEDLPLLANGKSGFNPFCGDQGIAPYQKVIDYANAKGALSFWAHPEQADETRFLNARLYTPARPAILEETHDYTGFSSFPRGCDLIPDPGGIWDQILRAYCEGKRTSPVWTMGESDFRKKEDTISNPTTVFIDRIKKKTDVLDALRRGRIYALDSPGADLYLNGFFITDKKMTGSASMGETLPCSTGAVTIRIDIESKTPLKKVTLIRDGIIIKESNHTHLAHRDRPLALTGKSFYRLDVVSSNGSRLLTNPIFVKRREIWVQE